MPESGIFFIENGYIPILVTLLVVVLPLYLGTYLFVFQSVCVDPLFSQKRTDVGTHKPTYFNVLLQLL